MQSDATAVAVRLQSEPFQVGSTDEPCVYALTFWAKFEGEETWTGYEAQTFDQLKVFVKGDWFKDQVFASAVATPNNSTHGDWRFFAADLTAYWHKTVRLQFEVDTVDGNNNLHFGAALDDIRVRSMPGDIPCSANFACPSDGDPCTDDECTLFSNAPSDADYVCESTGFCSYLPSETACP